jgi:bifunctional DNA-binding transcriptional regulator/antitoxin component of YhaV-PrlF toxin-antitoxin module
MDEKGRIVIPKDLRDAADISVLTKLLAIVKGRGRIELVVVDLSMKRSKEVATQKFAGWKEEHEADNIALRLANR